MLAALKNIGAAATLWKTQPATLRLLNALNSEDRGLKVRFSLATIAFDRESAQMSQILSSQGKNAPSNPYPHYLVRLATSRKENAFLNCTISSENLRSRPPSTGEWPGVRAGKCPTECFLSVFGHLARSAPKSAFWVCFFFFLWRFWAPGHSCKWRPGSQLKITIFTMFFFPVQAQHFYLSVPL